MPAAKKKCYNCGKVIRGKAYTKIGKYYCCSRCCKKGKSSASCEFC